MTLVDANVLLYAVNESEPRHEQARGWLDQSLSGRETVGFAWVVLLAFLRLSTKVGLFPRPLSVEQAITILQAWVGDGPGVIVQPTPRHMSVMAGLLKSTGTGGNITNDAHLAALALEHDALVVTFDSDFQRFSGARWARPEFG
ncbi:MAG TPA: type II toxin-antitoxin system VapC family toxin [Acidimicrobiales bacterium]|nr:type II toxin-antitoxin system VapC family toxin [Acidimicrobiales bacterium]